jgi:cholinesterase
VQQYAEYFGGDAESVTLMGESAGGGSIMYHLTSIKALSSGLPSKRAIIQSPFTLELPISQQRRTFRSSLQRGNVTSFSELKGLSTEKLQRINGLLVGNAAPYGTFCFGKLCMRIVIEDG